MSRTRHVLKKPATLIGWFTTAPHPWKKAHTHSADDGQIGWRLHAVPVSETGEPEKRGKALCGTWPRHGWGMDMFIDAECSRCAAAMTKREAAGETFVDVPEVRSAARAQAYNEGATAAWKSVARSENPYSEENYLHASWLRGFEEFT